MAARTLARQTFTRFMGVTGLPYRQFAEDHPSGSAQSDLFRNASLETKRISETS
jgi:hypothetical protein